MSKHAYTISKAYRGLEEIEKGFIAPGLKPALHQTASSLGMGVKSGVERAGQATLRAGSKAIDTFHGANVAGAQATKQKVGEFGMKLRRNAKPLAYGAAAGGTLVGTGAYLNKDN
jgi:hypothetical protein